MYRSLLIVISTILFASSCCTDSVLNKRSYRNIVEKDLNHKLTALKYHDQFDRILNQCQNKTEIDAISFLYAYMPLGDIIDYSPDLYIEGIRSAYTAITEMPWGKKIPREIFRHFVLPVRVNNEDLDNSRAIFYNELKDRVSGLSMYDAALEVNHWCHEKVIYTPSDARTSSPSATVRTAYGRCGEESVFTVAALRAVGIPARQVYTPRWAHTDDNHAWVEIWINGKWYYMGACEPEPELNVAWFSSTAQRGMLMHTRAFGYYRAKKEPVIQRTNCFTEINVTANYAPVEQITVIVNDKNGQKIQNAKVEYKIYNYAEFYSAITDFTNDKGESYATLGKGDILVWASSGKNFGFEKISVGAIKGPVTIILNKKQGDIFDIELDIIPPKESKVITQLTSEQIANNAIRLAIEDSIRNSYVATFAQPERASVILNKIIEKDNDASIKRSKKEYDNIRKYIENALISSRGNWKEIESYFLALSPKKIETGLNLLDVISEKDFRDTPAETLLDHVNNYSPDVLENSKKYDPEIVSTLKNYLLRPRVGYELLTPWRGIFQDNIDLTPYYDSPERAEKLRNLRTAQPEAIKKYITQITILNEYNPQGIPVRPFGVTKLTVSDETGRNLLFVTLCRSFNIPARIEEVSGKVQYYQGMKWNDVDFSNEGTASSKPKGYISLKYSPTKHIDDPKVETHFTISSLEDLTINTLNFRNVEGIEGTMSYNSRFRKPVELDEGYYMLTTGTRMASGKVLAKITSFNIRKESDTSVDILMREDENELQVIGNMNAEWRYDKLITDGKKIEFRGFDATRTENTSILETTGRGFFVLGFLKAGHEPSNHAIRSLFYKDLTRPAILLYPDKKEITTLNTQTHPDIPGNIYFGIDNNSEIYNAICKNLKLTNVELPLFIIADTFGRIVYYSEGYFIGVSDILQKHLNNL